MKHISVSFRPGDLNEISPTTLGQLLTLLAYFQNVIGSSLGRNTGIADSGLSWVLLTPSR
jgi:hypothetical protein